MTSTRARSLLLTLIMGTTTAFAALVACPRRASAQFGPNAISPGISAGVAFGPKTTFALTADLRYTYVFMGPLCTSVAPLSGGAGVFAQATWLNFAAWRFAAGIHGGVEPVLNTYGIDAEIGWTYRTADRRTKQTELGPIEVQIPAAHGIHLGLLQAFALASEFAVREAIPIGAPAGARTPETIISAGLRFPGPFGFQSYACPD